MILKYQIPKFGLDWFTSPRERTCGQKARQDLRNPLMRFLFTYIHAKKHENKPELFLKSWNWNAHYYWKSLKVMVNGNWFLSYLDCLLGKNLL